MAKLTVPTCWPRANMQKCPRWPFCPTYGSGVKGQFCQKVPFQYEGQIINNVKLLNYWCQHADLEQTCKSFHGDLFTPELALGRLVCHVCMTSLCYFLQGSPYIVMPANARHLCPWPQVATVCEIPVCEIPWPISGSPKIKPWSAMQDHFYHLQPN